MNFLDLCKKAVLKADLTSGITTTVGQVGILAKIVDWVVDAYDEIQGSEKWWNFLTKRDSASIIAGTTSYDGATFLPTDFDYFWDETIYFNIVGSFSGRIDRIEWKDYVEKFLYSELSTERPSVLAIDPTGRVFFNTIPDANYTINFDYQRKQDHFADNSDIPLLPADHHDLIWRLALIKYGEHYGALEVTEPAIDYFEDRMQTFRIRNLPQLKFSENIYHGYTAS